MATIPSMLNTLTDHHKARETAGTHTHTKTKSNKHSRLSSILTSFEGMCDCNWPPYSQSTVFHMHKH